MAHVFVRGCEMMSEKPDRKVTLLAKGEEYPPQAYDDRARRT